MFPSITSLMDPLADDDVTPGAYRTEVNLKMI